MPVLLARMVGCTLLQGSSHQADLAVPLPHCQCSLLLQRPRRASAGLCGYDLDLYVRWHSAAGGVRVNRLPLDPIAGVDDLRGLFKWV